MALVTITEAIKLSGVSRPTFYRKHIGDNADKVNRVSVKTIDGKKVIDTSELIRVFGELRVSGETSQRDVPVHLETSQLQAENEVLRAKLEAATEKADSLENDKQWLQGQIAELNSTIKLLEGPKHPRLWWQFWK